MIPTWVGSPRRSTALGPGTTVVGMARSADGWPPRDAVARRARHQGRIPWWRPSNAPDGAADLPDPCRAGYDTRVRSPRGAGPRRPAGEIRDTTLIIRRPNGTVRRGRRDYRRMPRRHTAG